MKKITAIQAQSRVRAHLGTRVNIFLDDEFAFAIDAEVARNANLRIGKYLGPEEIAELEDADGAAKALALAINFLGYRARSSHEIRERLRRDDAWSDDTIARVLEKLAALNLVSDRAFAQSWIESRSRSKPRGSFALRAELRQKGVGREDIEAALQESVPDDAAEIENAVAALRSKARQWEKLEGREREQKMLAFLGRRGFGFGVGKSAIKQLDAEESEA